MYARITTLPVVPGSRELADELGKQILEIMNQLPGNQSVTLLSDEQNGELGAFSIWETREQAEADYKELRDAIQQTLGGALSGLPTVRVYEVYSG